MSSAYQRAPSTAPPTPARGRGPCKNDQSSGPSHCSPAWPPWRSSLTSAALAQQSLVRPGVTSTPTAADQKNFKIPHNVFGQPDLEGVWSNATVTPLERDAKFGDRLTMTPQELASREKEEKEYIAEGDQPTDPNLKVTDLPVNCGRGFSGTNCGYNRGWTDPGETVMRVKGEPRTSFITSTPNGRMPPD